LVASKKNIGKKITFKTKKIKIVGIQEAIDKVPEIAIFCASSEVSKKWAQKFVDSGTSVIDNSSFFRMEENIPLIVPEVNGNILKKSNKIIANPNCSTIQMVVALNDIYKKFGLKRLVISTYQSVSGTGQAAVKQMMDERQGLQPERVYPYQIDQNCFPHGGDFLENGYTTEELKLINETHKILNDSSIKITATVVRIPVVGGHSESINIETHRPFQIEEIKKTLSDTAGVKVQDNPSKFDYPMPITAHKKNDVFVGRIRKDETVENGLNIWIVADNLRKGAATNAVQIADYIFKKNLSKV
jgi:aspartate-semialdehyde dehydrogenase